MANTHGFIKLPPDGSGKRVPQSVMLEFNYDTGTEVMAVGDVVTFSTTTWTGVVLEEGDTIASGELHVRIPDPVPQEITLVGGEDILVGGVKVAQVAAIPNTSPYYFQQGVIAGGENMIHTLSIDERGSAQVEFSTGAPNFDGFGRLQVSQNSSLGEYIQAYDDLPDFFGDTVGTGGSKAYDNNTRTTTLTCDTTATAAYKRSTHQYHLYQAGKSTLYEMTVAVGDSGKANSHRTWGAYDDKNGVFFHMDATFAVTLRSNVTGSVVDTNFLQEDFNVDKMDGSRSVFNPSGLTLDVTTVNIYWIDYQWLGAGRVRFGVIIGGRRIIMHQIQNANANVSPYMSTGSLPFTYECFNTGITASPSTLKFTCCHVTLEGHFDPERVKQSGVWSKAVTTTTDTVIAAVRPLQTFKGVDNRSEIIPSMFIGANSGAATEPMIFKIWYGSVTGGVWSDHITGYSISEENTTCTIDSAVHAGSILVGGGSTSELISDAETTLYRYNDITTSPVVIITAALLSAGTGGQATAAVNWSEVKK